MRASTHPTAFVKIDAEGEESNILKGGKNFFKEQSPLVQYEIKAGRDLHLDLVDDFYELGYLSYRLVPGMDILVPFNKDDDTDGYLLNLFCCKQDRAAQLAADGFLIEAGNLQAAEKKAEYTRTPEYKYEKKLLSSLTQHPYGMFCSNSWDKTKTEDIHQDANQALAHYLESRDMSLSVVERYIALKNSFLVFKSLCETQMAYLRLSSLARVALDYGARSVAVNALTLLCNYIFKEKQIDIAEPFLAPSERFDSIPPRESIVNWMAAAALEELENKASFSSFYSRDTSRQRLNIIHQLAFESREMNRRRDLLSQRFGTNR